MRWTGILIILCLVISGLSFANTLWIHSKAWLAQQLIARAWEQTISSGKRHSPWPWADFWPVARLHSSRGGRELVVLNTASGEALSFGPAFVHGNTGSPSADDGVIAAHRDTHFRFLEEIENGDELLMQHADGRYSTYTVASMEVIDSRYRRLQLADGFPLKLVTCYPFDALLPGGPQRLVISLVKARSGKLGEENFRVQRISSLTR